MTVCDIARQNAAALLLLGPVADACCNEHQLLRPAVFDSLIADLVERDVLADPRLARRLRLVMLDTAAVAIAALQVPLLVTLQRQRARLEAGPVLLPGMSSGLNPTASASLLATAACWDELVGGDARSHGRPALAVVPVVLALAYHDHRDLAAALNALLLGYEVAARLGRSYAVPPGEHVDGTWQTPGAAVAAAYLLGADTRAIAEAASMGACVMTRSLFAPVHEGRSGRLLYAAVAVERGMAIASAACAGFRGPERPVEAPALQSLLSVPPQEGEAPAAILDAYAKFDPGARHLHYAAAASRRWLAAYGPWNLSSEAEATLLLRTYPEACRYCGQRDPQNRIQAQFSLVFAVATTLLHGGLRSDDFSEVALADPRLRSLMARIQLEPEPSSAGRWAELHVCSPGAPPRSARVDRVDGDLDDPDEEERLVDNRRRLLTPLLGEKTATCLIHHWWTAPLHSPLLPDALSNRGDSPKG